MPGLDDILDGDIDVDILPSLDDIKDAIVPSLQDFGVDLIKGIENGYNYLRGQMVGKEDKIVTAFTVGSLSVLAGIFIFSRARKGVL